MRKLIVISVFILVIFATEVSAHCPLCTVGAGAAAAGAVWLGVQKAAVSFFIWISDGFYYSWVVLYMGKEC